MFQFPGFAFIPYGFRNEYLLLISASPKIAKPPRRPQTFRFEAAQAKPGRRPASAHPECASRGTSTDRLFGITEIEGGFPHSEILGSKPVRGSPRLIAAYHVLHRLSAPRHPPDTLKTLDCSHYQRSSLGSDPCPTVNASILRCAGKRKALIYYKDQFCFKHIRELCGQAKPTTEMLAGSRG